MAEIQMRKQVNPIKGITVMDGNICPNCSAVMKQVDSKNHICLTCDYNEVPNEIVIKLFSWRNYK